MGYRQHFGKKHAKSMQDAGGPQVGFENISFIERVKSGTSGHLEVVQNTFDTSIFSYQELLDLYWPQFDPTNDGGQFF